MRSHFSLAPVVLLAAPCLSQCPPGSVFLPRTDTAGTSLAFGIDAIDVNADGYPDLVAAHLSNQLSVMLNDGSGGLLAPTNYPTIGSRPEEVVGGDLNSDGAPDLVVCNQSSDDVNIFLNNGDGTFAPAYSVPVGDGPRQAALVDMNHDSALDLVVANRELSGTGNVAILLGAGDGTFAPAQAWDVGEEVNALCIGHFDDDADPDVAVVYLGSAGAGGVRAFLGDGAGGLSTLDTANFGGFPYRITAADLDGDGLDDLAAVTADLSQNGSGDDVVVLLNVGGAGLVSQPLYPAGDQPLSIAAFDADGDGDTDLVTTNTGGNDMVFLVNAGNGTFSLGDTIALPSSSDPRDATVLDADLDGDLDVVIASRSSTDAMSVIINDCGAPPPVLTEQPASQLVDTGDDAVLRIALAGELPTPSVQWRRDGVDLVNGGGVTGADSMTLTLSQVTGDDAALYDAIVTSSAGMTISDPAILGVRPGCTADLAAPFDVLDFSDVLAFLSAFGAGCP